MADADSVPLTLDDLRAVAGFAANCAAEVLTLFEQVRPTDARPREAIEAARTFARGGKRGKALRDTAWAALRAAGEAGDTAAGQAARACVAAAGAAYLHPLAKATQVKHVLGAAAHAARALEMATDGDASAAERALERARQRATPVLVDVLRRYPAVPAGGGRVGELMRELDRAFRERA